MATVEDIVNRAFKKIAIVSRDETAEPFDLSEGVTAYNSMIHAWRLAGVDFEFTDQTASDAFTLGDEYQEGVVYNLASRLSPDYVTPANFDADDWFRKFQAAQMVIADVEQPLALRRTSLQYSNGFYRYRGL